MQPAHVSMWLRLDTAPKKVMALGVYRENGRAGHLALSAMVMSFVSNCLIPTFFGVSTSVLPAIGQAYLANQHGAVRVNEAIFRSALVPLTSSPGLLYITGIILLGGRPLTP
jgi:hypothetical protein